MKKKTKNPGLLEVALLAFALLLGVRMAAPLMQEQNASASDLSDMATWTGQVVPGMDLDPVLPLPVIADSGAVLSTDVPTLQAQLAEARATVESLQAQVRTLQDQLNVALSGELVQAQPVRYAEDGTPYASPVDPKTQGLLCTYFQVGC